MPRLRAANCSSSSVSGSLGIVTGAVGASPIGQSYRPGSFSNRRRRRPPALACRRSRMIDMSAGGGAPAARLISEGSAVLGEELHHVVEPETPVATLADA